MKDADLAATIVGGLGAVITATSPIINAMQPGSSLHVQDWMQLAMAAVFGIFGWVTNKKSTGV